MAVADLPLLQQNDWTFKGYYRLPATKHPSDTHPAPLSYAEGKAVYNPANNSLIMTGFKGMNLTDSEYMPICELVLPSTPPVNSPNKNDLATCTWAGPSKTVCQYIPSMLGPTWIGNAQSNGQMIGSLTIDSVNNRLVCGTWLFYDGDPFAPPDRPSHFSLPLNFSTANAGNIKQPRRMKGTYTKSTGGTVNLGGACFSLYETKVPAEWQSTGEFSGVTNLCGGSQISVVERAGATPVCWSFDPTYFSRDDGDPVVSTPQQSTMFLHSYGGDLSFPWTGAGDGVVRYDGSPQMPFNCTAYTTGMVAVPGTRTMVYTGSVGTGWLYYGGPAENSKRVINYVTYLPDQFANGTQDTIKAGRGYHSVAYPAGWRKLPIVAGEELYDDQGSPNNYGVYTKYAWLFDAVDLLKVRNGEIHPRNLMPYAHFPLPTSIDHPFSLTSGAAWDAVNRRLYIISGFDADIVGYTSLPIIFVYELAAPANSGTPQPQLHLWGPVTAA